MIRAMSRAREKKSPLVLIGKIKQAQWSVEKAIDICKTIYSVNIQTHLSDTIHTRLYVDKYEQQLLLDMFNIQFG